MGHGALVLSQVKVLGIDYSPRPRVSLILLISLFSCSQFLQTHGS
ncbi:hypothetical protein [Nostoc paludosum]|nr:hypothetical protein [Nostoc paludosum]